MGQATDSVFHRRLRLSAPEGESQRELARRAGLPPTTFSRIWNGGIPDLEQAVAIAKALGKTMEWMMSDGDEGGAASVRIRNLVLEVSPNGNLFAVKDDDTFTSLPADILTRSGVAQDAARVLTARGLAMTPTIDDGDLLLIDTTPAEISDGNIYAVTIGSELHIRRLRKMGGRVLMRADNQTVFPGEEEVPRDPAMIVHGRVRWAGHVF
jgi:SOS-response transcriptional repressor LexA